MIERAVQAIEGQVRTLKLALESRIGVTISSDHDIVPWIVEHAAVIVNKGQVGADGKTAYERLKGKPAHLCGLEFGERILCKSNVPARERRNKMDADWKHGVFLGQRALSGEYMVGTPEGVCRPRSIHRRPQEKRWEEVLSYAVGLPWKLSKDHDGDKEVFLDENPEEASSSPTVSPLPPIIMEEPIVATRSFYVTAKDVDPKYNGIGFTEGCKGCQAIVNGKSPVAHSKECRLRLMEQAPNNEKIAARVKRSLASTGEFLAKEVERGEEKRRKESEAQVPPQGGEGSAGASRAQVGGSSSSSMPAPPVTPVPSSETPSSRKRGAEGQLDSSRNAGTSVDPGVPTGDARAAQPDQPMNPIPSNPVRSSPTKRPATEELNRGVHRWMTGEETGPTSEEDPYKDRKLMSVEEDPNEELKLNLVEDLVDALEEGAVKLAIGDGEVQMRVCEEPLDLSFLVNPEAELLDGALEISNVGVVCSDLKDKAAMCMLRSLCEVSPFEDEDPLKEDLETESIFNPGSKMGLEDRREADYWEYDSSNATWARIIVIPRTGFYHPSEGAADEKDNSGPKLSNLRSYRWTVPDGLPPIKDNWEKDAGEIEAEGKLVEWTGRVIFGERWASEDSEGELRSRRCWRRCKG